MSTKKESANPLFAALKRRGYTMRSAGEALGVTPGHLYRVLSGERHSVRLTAAVRALVGLRKEGRA